MTAFNLDVLLLLFAAFVLGLALGLWLRRARRGHGEGVERIPVPAGAPARPTATTQAVPVGEQSPAGAPVGEAERSKASLGGDAVPAPPGAAPPAAAGPGPARAPREPVADLFGHLLNVPPGAIADEPEPEPESSRRTVERGNHPGAPPPVLGAPDGGVADDLKLLKGIGPQNEQRLHGLGIFHFRQIAAWTPEEVAWVGSYLAFPGRIEREDWIGQARALASGERPDARASRRPKGEA